MAQLLDAVVRFRKVEEATAPKDDPAPVYLLDEIADLARQSPESAQAIADAVQKKLGAKSPVVKFKALRVIKHLCSKGCSQFQRCMQRSSQSVRELIHYRGDPDPFKGDVPNARVREFAKEVVEVMYNSAPVTNTSNTLAAQGKIQGFGSAGPESSFSSSSRYGGIGSSSSASYRSSAPSSLAQAQQVAQQAASQITQAAQHALGEGPIAQGIASAASALGGFLQPAGYGSKLNEAGYRDNNHSPSDSFGYSNASSYAAPAVSQVAASQVLGSEEGLVDDITAPGGLRALPDVADLRRFVDTASNMDGLRVAELLREKLGSSRWQEVLRALAALEAVLQRGSAQACGEIAVMFQSDPTPVRSCLQSSQQQVQQHAAAVLKLLTGEDVAVPAAGLAAAITGKKGAAANKAAAAAAAVADLLGEDPDVQPAAPAAPAASKAAPGGIDDLLGDFATPAAAPAPATAAPAAAPVDAALDGLSVLAAPSAHLLTAKQAPTAAGGLDDMFGGLTLARPGAAAAAQPHAAVPAAAPASQNAAPLGDLFSGLTPSSSMANSTGAGVLGQQLGQQPTQLQQQLLQPQLQSKGGPPVQGDLLGGLGLQGPNLQPLSSGLGSTQQQWGGGSFIAANSFPAGSAGLTGQSYNAALGQLQHGCLQKHGSGSGTGSKAWSGHDDVSNLLRQVGHGGKYDPAFDFVTDEFKKR